MLDIKTGENYREAAERLQDERDEARAHVEALEDLTRGVDWNTWHDAAEILASQQAWKRAADGWPARVVSLETIVADYAEHDSWRCAHYPECRCGLDDLTDSLGLPRVPRPPK